MVSAGSYSKVSTGGYSIMGVGICVPDSGLAIAMGQAVAIGQAGLGGITTIAIG